MESGRAVSGAEAFKMGLVCLWLFWHPVIAIPLLVWLANPLFWIGATALLAGKPNRAKKCGLWATFLAAGFLLVRGDWSQIGAGYGAGYVLWLLSMGLLAAAGAWAEMYAVPTERRMAPPDAPAGRADVGF